MMGWTLALLFGSAVLLFILSFIKAKQASEDMQQQIDQLSFSLLDEINKLKERVRNLELEAEITAHEAGISSRRHLVREALDLYRRGYSFESIASKTQLTEAEIEQLLTPYMKPKNEGGTGVQ
jgi:hypothetical protein